MRKQFSILLILVFVFGLVPVNFSKATDLASRLKGRILLQVESKGEAWYVNPDNGKRYSLGMPDYAFQVMRELGLGISNKDFDSFNGVAPSRLAGKILLKVEDKGKAYYVNPVDFKMYFLGKPADAFQVMRTQGLGITNKDIEAIAITFQINNLTTNNASIKIPEKNSQPVITETWEQQEARDFAYADARGWSSLISTNLVGEKRYYRKEGAKWVQKNSEAEAIEKYVVPPTLEQLAKLRNLCILGGTDVNASMCGNTNFMDAYYTNEVIATWYK